MKNVKINTEETLFDYHIDKDGFIYGQYDRPLTIYKNGKGEFVKMYHEGSSKSFHIHELIAYTFLEYEKSEDTIISYYPNKKTKLNNVKISNVFDYVENRHGFKKPKFLKYDDKKYTKYIVDIDGRVFNTETYKILSEHQTPQGYVFVTLNLKTRMMHRILYSTYVEPMDPDLVINHKDGIKSNNTLSNLEQVTTRENSMHAINTGLIETFGPETIEPILTLYYGGEGRKHISERLGINYNTVRYIIEKHANHSPDFINRTSFNLLEVEKIFKLKEKGYSYSEISKRIDHKNISTIGYTLNNKNFQRMFKND